MAEEPTLDPATDYETAIAVIGMSCRFPDAATPEEFWENLRNGRESVREVSRDTLLAAGYDAAVLHHPQYVKSSVVLDGIKDFDAGFFGFSAREAEILDPQQRLFLECAWEALEDAGHDPSRYPGLIGVYGGVDMSFYLFQLYGNPELVASVGVLPIAIANDKDHLATRVAYKLNLRGPAVTVQSACSTSLVAVCQACQALLDYHCDMVLAGGCAITVPQGIGYVFQEGGISSPDGHCRAFSAEARGTMGGSGAGLVVLKRLADALADRDSVRAVIRGFAVNNDGSGKVGYTAPSVAGQAEVIAMAQAMAGVAPETVTYVEGHGTGTPLGDPIELAALIQTFRASTARKQFCGIGSVKSNIGHLNSAAGVAGLIKTVLALEHRTLPPSLHCEHPNPSIDWSNSPFFVVSSLQEWREEGGPRRAGVSSFGIGGTNAHVVVEEAGPTGPESPGRTAQLLTVSARSAAALELASTRLARYLATSPPQSLADVAYTLQVGRRAFDHRRAFVVPTGGCADVDGSACVGNGECREPPPIVFLFPGQGTQYVDMGRDLYLTEATFQAEVDRCAEVLREQEDLDLLGTLFPSPETLPAAQDRLRQTAFTQPALFVVEYALARLWMSWGIRPEAMLGHSVGEYVAACLAGVMSLEDALRLVALRGRLMQSTAPGSMLAAMLPLRDVLRHAPSDVCVAAVNGPTQTVLSGPDTAIGEAAQQLRKAGFNTQVLQTSHAFHSHLMDPILERFRAGVERVALDVPQQRYLSNLTGTWADADTAADPSYWVRHLRSPVQFAEGVATLARSGPFAYLEVGPGRTLSELVVSNYPRSQAPLVLPSLPARRDSARGVEIMLGSLGRLWTAGCSVDWSGFHRHERRRRVPLPTYPFERQRYWVEPPRQAAPSHQGRSPIDEWFYEPVWEERPLKQPKGALTLGRCLVFCDDSSFSHTLLARLRAAGCETACVRPGELSLRGEEFRIDPSVPEHYARVIQELSRRGWVPGSVLHLWNLGSGLAASEGRQSGHGIESLESLLYLAQGLGTRSGLETLTIHVASSGLHSIEGQEKLAPRRALLLGACRVLPQENSGLCFSSIDVPAPEADASNDEILAATLLAELGSTAPETVVAHRAGQRWVQTYQRARLPALPAAHPRLRHGGVYLITGGLGGIGLAIADYLARTVAARLVLVGRTALPDRASWRELIASSPENSQTRRHIQSVLGLEAAGAQVLTIAADVSDPQQMAGVANRIRNRFGTLHGIVHAAGVAGGGLALLKTREQASKVVSPKVDGAEVLKQCLAHETLDFLALCSSLSSVLGGFGQVDYCAANCVLDAMAYAWGGARTHVVAIDWDTWAESGMAVETSVPPELQAAKEENLRRGLTDREGAEVFARILASDLPCVQVSTTDLFARLEAAASGSDAHRPSATSLSTHTAPVSTPSLARPTRHPRPNLSSPLVPASTETERRMVAIWQDLLGVEPIGLDDSFLELGGHSLLAIQGLGRIRSEFGVVVTIPEFFENPTLRELAGLVGGSGAERSDEPELVALPRRPQALELTGYP